MLALLATIAATVVAATPPLAGWLSDRARRRGGDRRVQTAMALGVDVAALAGIGLAASAGELALALAAATVALTAAQTIYQALLPDLVPRGAWGMASGVRGLMTLTGTVVGLLCAALLAPRLDVAVMAAAIVVSALSLFAVGAPRRVQAPVATPHRAKVRDRYDLGVTVVARGWIVLGMMLLNTYVLYFFHDVLGVRNASLGTGLVAGAALLGAIVSTIAAGRLSDRMDRRMLVALAGVPMVLAAVGFALVPDARLIFVYAALFGLGYGAVFAIGWALALDAVPELGDAARDLGIWGTLSSLPGIAAPGLGAWLISRGATPAIGYRFMFAAAGVSFGLGSLTVLAVGRRPRAPVGSALLLGLTTVLRQPLLSLHVRVRQWGRLPRRRGPTVLVANHQHEDESEIVVERAFLQGPMRPIFTASTRRMYEPGFFAVRMPWLAPFAKDFNAGAFFVALGLLPLENELAVRPLRTLAREIRERHGSLPVREVFREGAPLPADARELDDLLKPSAFAVGETRVRLAALLEPHRTETLTALRATIDADIARIVDVVRRGATFYVTPEGFYSTDGRMRPLKGILEHLVAVAEPWLAAIAYDPFRGRRLSLLYRVLRPARSDDLATSLAAARPVTTSALLATWILAVGLPFQPSEAVDGVARLRAALPPAAFVDPEFDRDPAACVNEALRNLAGRGALVQEGGGWRLGDRRGDERFAGVDDMIAFQAAFHRETLAGLARLAAPAQGPARAVSGP